jgi:hypothetical protein
LIRRIDDELNGISAFIHSRLPPPTGDNVFDVIPQIQRFPILYIILKMWIDSILFVIYGYGTLLA